MITAAIFITDFADAGTMAPVGIVVALALIMLGRRDLALRWSVTTLCVWSAMLLLKLFGYTLAGSWLDQFTGVTPSAHVAAGATCFAGLLALCGVGRLWVLSAALLVAVTVGATRVLLGDHTAVETLVGMAVGLSGAAAMQASMRGRALERGARVRLLGAVGLVILLVHGTHLTWEPMIRSASAHVRSILVGLR